MKYKLVSSLILSLSLSACGGASSGGSTDSGNNGNSGDTSYDGVPYDYIEYKNALDNANLQQNNPPGEDKYDVVKAGDYDGFENPYFYIDADSGWLTFAMSGDSNRSELRFVENFRSDLSDTQYILKAEVLPINPSQSVANSGDGEEMTLLQVHNKGESGETDDSVLSHPLLRVIWDGGSRTDDNSGQSYDNAYWAVIKSNAYECKNEDNPNYNSNCPDSYGFYHLADYDAQQATAFEIIVRDKQLVINVDEQQQVDIDISYWSHLYSYFKAGVYNQYEDGNSIVQFKSLSYLESAYDADASATNLPMADLNPSLPPSGNFDLLDWYLSIATDTDGNGYSDSIKEIELSNGYENSEFFYTASDGGMVFKDYIGGYKTSQNTKYTRTELREMLRRGDSDISTQGVNENNWVFSSAPLSEQNKAGGIDGLLEATLAVNAVTSSGENYQRGRVIVGQIHANDDEPIRIYYRLLPGHNKGSIYFAHEPRNSDEQWHTMIGSKSDSASEPSDGIELNEKFFYQIKVEGNTLTLTIKRDDKADVVKSIDMSDSGFDESGQYMYFKAGVYNQNSTGDADDYVQATFYYLNNSHTGYNP